MAPIEDLFEDYASYHRTGGTNSFTASGFR